MAIQSVPLEDGTFLIGKPVKGVGIEQVKFPLRYAAYIRKTLRECYVIKVYLDARVKKIVDAPLYEGLNLRKFYKILRIL